MDVVGIVEVRFIAVNRLVRRRNKEESIWSENSLNLGKKLLVVVNMFQRFEADHYIKEAFALDGNVGDRADFELEVGSDVFVLSMLNGLFINIDPDHMLSSSRQ